MYVRNLSGDEFPAQITRTVESEINTNSIMSATIQPTTANLRFLNNMSEVWKIVDENDTVYVPIYFKKKGIGQHMQVDIKAIPLFFDEMNVQRIYERYDQSFTAAAYFTLIFANSGYNFQLSGTFYAQQFAGVGEGATRLEEFRRGIERFGAEFEIIGTTVHLRNLIGNDTQFRYEYKLNASNIVQEIDANELWTYARGYGDYGDGEGGEDWQNAKLFREYTSPIANLIGKRDAPPIKNGNITTISTMDEQLQLLVNESLKISATADIHDLRKQNYPIAQAKLGDRSFLIDRRISFDEEVRVVRIRETRNWKDDLIGLDLTFGTPGIVRRHQSKLESARKEITDFLAGKIKLPFSSLDAATQAATRALLSAQSELTFENGIVAVDKNDPNFVTIFNSAGIGVSTDWGATFDDAITRGGVNTSLLTAGSINTGNITIIGENEFFYWDGNALEAIDPDDVRRYVRLTSKGLYVARGAITIEREDGHKVIDNGMSAYDVNIQAITLPMFHGPGVASVQRTYSIWMRSRSTTSLDYNQYRFKRDARYLKVRFRVLASGSNTGYLEIWMGGSVVASSSTTLTDEYAQSVLNGQTLTVDMGVPNGLRETFQVRMRSSQEGEDVFAVVSEYWLEG